MKILQSKVPSWMRPVGAGLAVAVLGVLGAAGCSPAYLDLCERAASCGGGRDLEVDACVADMDRREELSIIYGCEPYWEDYVSCMDERSYCEHEHLTGCNPYRDSYNHCVDANDIGQAKVESEHGDEVVEAVEPGPPPAADAEVDADTPKPPKKSKCSLAHAGAAPGGPDGAASWLLSIGLGLALLRRRRWR